MAYTSTDLSTVKAAKLALASGTTVKRVTLNGKTIEYETGASLEQLNALQSEIISEINQNASRPRFVFTRSTKGL